MKVVILAFNLLVEQEELWFFFRKKSSFANATGRVSPKR